MKGRCESHELRGKDRVRSQLKYRPQMDVGMVWLRVRMMRWGDGVYCERNNTLISPSIRSEESIRKTMLSSPAIMTCRPQVTEEQIDCLECLIILRNNDERRFTLEIIRSIITSKPMVWCNAQECVWRICFPSLKMGGVLVCYRNNLNRTKIDLKWINEYRIVKGISTMDIGRRRRKKCEGIAKRSGSMFSTWHAGKQTCF